MSLSYGTDYQQLTAVCVWVYLYLVLQRQTVGTQFMSVFRVYVLASCIFTGCYWSVIMDFRLLRGDFWCLFVCQREKIWQKLLSPSWRLEAETWQFVSRCYCISVAPRGAMESLINRLGSYVCNDFLNPEFNSDLDFCLFFCFYFWGVWELLKHRWPTFCSSPKHLTTQIPWMQHTKSVIDWLNTMLLTLHIKTSDKFSSNQIYLNFQILYWSFLGFCLISLGRFWFQNRFQTASFKLCSLSNF